MATTNEQLPKPFEDEENLENEINFPNGKFVLNENANAKFTETIVDASELQMSIPFEKRDEKKIQYLKEMFFNKLFASEPERKVHLLYDSTALFGHKPRQVMFNVGENSKSIWSNILLKLMGSYALRINTSKAGLEKFFFGVGSKRLVGKRFILIEGINDPSQLKLL